MSLRDVTVFYAVFMSTNWLSSETRFFYRVSKFSKVFLVMKRE